MRETPVQKQASLHPAVVEEIGKTGKVPAVAKRGPRGPYKKREEPKVDHALAVGDTRFTFYRTGDPETTVSYAQAQSLVDKRVIKRARKIIDDGARVYTRIEIVDHETVIVR